MKRIVLISLILMSGVIGGIFITRVKDSGQIVTPLLAVPPKITPTFTPTPNPIIINVNTNLRQELEKLDPPDFSQDFKNLGETISNP